MSRTAVVLFNLGGPDRLEAVRPFLFNLFSDPAIIRLPAPFRQLVAGLIAWRRAPTAKAIYSRLGGGSPLLEQSRAQASALEGALAEGGTVRTFVVMRYWHPFSSDVAAEVKAFAPDRVVLLPLYPQYSTTTTASSLKDWRHAARGAGIDVPTVAVCCYPTAPGLVSAYAEAILAAWDQAARHGRPRLLFSAHGLPKKVVAAGDPYQWQVEQTAAAVVEAVGKTDLDWVLCYQSRVGPLAWLGPSTEEEIARAGADRVPVIVTPIAFVSEHSETLVELDMEYRELAREKGVPAFVRVPTPGTAPGFVAALADLVKRCADGASLCSGTGGRLCPPGHSACAFAERIGG